MTEKTFYAAGRYSRRLEIAQYATMLESYGWKCTASWLKGEHESNDGSGTERDHIEWARQDEADIRAAGVFIVFTGENRRGGMHTELGIARALGKRCVIIGERPENIFYGGLERWDMADFDLCAGNLTASPPCEAQQKPERPAKPKTGSVSSTDPLYATPPAKPKTCGKCELRMMANFEALKAEREGMVWENVSRQHRGLAIAYDDVAFNALAEQFNKVFNPACPAGVAKENT